MKKSCPVVRFVVHTINSTDIRSATIEALVNGKQVGKAGVVKDRSKPPYVWNIWVDPKTQRCGIGTKLYEQAASYACKALREPLHSDRLRTAMSDGFWAKQVAKGRASCATRTTKPSGKLDPKQPIIGRSGCERFRLTCPAPVDLSRRKK